MSFKRKCGADDVVVSCDTRASYMDVQRLMDNESYFPELGITDLVCAYACPPLTDAEVKQHQQKNDPRRQWVAAIDNVLCTSSIGWTARYIAPLVYEFLVLDTMDLSHLWALQQYLAVQIEQEEGHPSISGRDTLRTLMDTAGDPSVHQTPEIKSACEKVLDQCRIRSVQVTADADRHIACARELTAFRSLIRNVVSLSAFTELTTAQQADFGRLVNRPGARVSTEAQYNTDGYTALTFDVLILGVSITLENMPYDDGCPVVLHPRLTVHGGSYTLEQIADTFNKRSARLFAFNAPADDHRYTLEAAIAAVLTRLPPGKQLRIGGEVDLVDYGIRVGMSMEEAMCIESLRIAANRQDYRVDNDRRVAMFLA